MTGYDEGQVVAYQADVRAAYAEAHEPYDIADDAHVIWTARMQYDAMQQGYAVSRQIHLAELRRQLRLGDPSEPAPALHGALRVVGNQFADDAGVWPWRMITAFDAFRLFLRADMAQLAAYAAWSRDVGANGWRVFGMWSLTNLRVQDYGEEYYPLLGAFLDYCAHEGLRVEFTVFTDAQILMPNVMQQRRHLHDVYGVAAPNVTFEVANEYEKNGIDPAVLEDVPRVGRLVAMGAPLGDGRVYDPSLGYSTVHNRREAEWFRYVGKDIGVDARAVTRDAIVADEPNKLELTGYLPAAWELAAYNAAMFCAGMTVHGNSLTLQRCVVPTGEEDDLVRRSFAAMARVPIAAPAWAYARYGPAAPNVPMPVERDQDDDTTIRLYAKVGEHDACALSLHHSAEDGWRPHGANGWEVVAQTGPFVICHR